MNDIHPNRLPTNIPLLPIFLEGAGILLGIFLLVGMLWWWKYKRKKMPAPIITPKRERTSAKEEALTALKKLEQEAETLSTREGFLALAEILRNFFNQSTEELAEKELSQENSQHSPLLEENTKVDSKKQKNSSALTFQELLKTFPDKRLQQFFVQCEQGEFAEHPPQKKDFLATIGRAKELVSTL
ncbi:hypothetical protein IPN35_00735 [Candidatus Peregrinibacteria bacterium]|nr:MAG: hypothetical protein IPN35_00735 [Candidatus Peregrinibacteria bacterium]